MMTLAMLGFNDWFESRLDRDRPKEHRPARVAAVDRDSFVIIGEGGECRAELTGRLLYSADSPLDYPTVGDWVYVQYFDEGTFAVVHGLLPRRNLLKRKTPGRAVEVQLIAANIDTAFIIQSLDANFNLQRLERYLVVTAESRIRPVVLLSKSDMVPDDDVRSRLLEIKNRQPDIKTLSFSNFIEGDVAQIKGLLSGGETFCMLGSSGVGKTTLINRLIGADTYKTHAVREKDDKGRHTTSRRQLTLLENGAVLIDTPGMRELGTFDVESGIESTFSEIAGLSEKCRFADCSHMQEAGCAVLDAVEKGAIEQKQYENYIKMVKESRHYSMTYLEKRRKDRDFGRMVRSVKRIKGDKGTS